MIITLVKILVSIGIAIVVYLQLDTSEFLNTLKGIDYLFFILAFIVFNISRILGAYRLHLYISKFAPISLLTNLKLYYVGMFYNLLLPGGISGDGYKALVYKNAYQVPYKKSITLLLIDRVSGLFMLLLLLIGSMLLDSNHISGEFIKNLLTISADIYALLLYMGLGFVVILSLIFYRLSAQEFLPIKYYIEGTSLVLQLMQILSFILLLYAVGEEVSMLYVSIFLVSSVASILPISFGGIGVRELIFILTLGLLGQDANQGVVAALLFSALTLFSALIGIFYQKNPT